MASGLPVIPKQRYIPIPEQTPECMKLDPDKADSVFYPGSRTGGTMSDEAVAYTNEAIKKARVYCDPCPAREWCEENYISERHGIFFGTSPRQRSRLRAKRNGVVS